MPSREFVKRVSFAEFRGLASHMGWTAEERAEYEKGG
jgi:hypothetical protein